MDLRLLSFALGASSSLLWPWLPSWEWGGLMLLLALYIQKKKFIIDEEFYDQMMCEINCRKDEENAPV